MEYLLEGREPKMALRYFEEISRIPRGSGNEEAISQYLLDFAKEQGLETWRDEHFNVCITKPGSQGCENLPPLMLQGHTDMVCEKNRDVDHDFLKDPIQLVVEGNILRAKGTTLGADNGVAVAWMMSILQDRTLVHPPLECVFTASEEVGLIGAHNLDYSRFQSRRLINLDCGPEGVFCCGSAGGQVTDFTLPLTMEEGNGALLRLAIRGLSGGHSGGLIHMRLGNANVLMGRLFRRLMEEMECRVQSCQGGDKDNAIPRECDAVLLVPQDRLDAAQALVKQTEEEIRSQLMPADKDFRVEITTETAGTYQAASLEQSRQMMRLMVMLPCGPQLRDLTMNDRVVASENFASVYTSETECKCIVSMRSSNDAYRQDMAARLDILGDLLGAAVRHHDDYESWEIEKNSPIRQTVLDCYKALTGKEGKVVATHGGLECGIFQKRMPGVDMVTMSCNSEGAHSPEEHMELDSFARTYDLLKAVLQKLCQ